MRATFSLVEPFMCGEEYAKCKTDGGCTDGLLFVSWNIVGLLFRLPLPTESPGGMSCSTWSAVPL